MGASRCCSLAWHGPTRKMAEICPPWLDLVRDQEEMERRSLPTSRALPLDLLLAELAPVLSHMLQSVSRPSGNSSW